MSKSLGRMDKRASGEIHVLLTNGKKIHFTRREIQSFLLRPRVLAFQIIVLLLLAVANPTLFPAVPDYSSRVFYWGLCIAIYLLLAPVWVDGFYTIWSKISEKPMPHLLSSAPFLLLLTCFAYFLENQFNAFLPPVHGTMSWLVVLQNIVIGHTIELIGAVWLYPTLRTAFDPGADKSEAKASPKFVVFNGQSIPLWSIKTVKSAEHYLIVSTELKTVEYRGKFKDFLGQIGEEHGIQTHRSHWVSTDEALELHGLHVKTKSGVNIPVARGRLPIVKGWFHTQEKPHKSSGSGHYSIKASARSNTDAMRFINASASTPGISGSSSTTSPATSWLRVRTS